MCCGWRRSHARELDGQVEVASERTSGRVGAEKHCSAVIHAQEHVWIGHVSSHHDQALKVGVSWQQIRQVQRLDQRARPPQQPHLGRGHLQQGPAVGAAAGWEGREDD